MHRDPTIVGRTNVMAETFAGVINSFVDPISWKTMVCPPQFPFRLEAKIAGLHTSNTIIPYHSHKFGIIQSPSSCCAGYTAFFYTTSYVSAYRSSTMDVWWRSTALPSWVSSFSSVGSGWSAGRSGAGARPDRLGWGREGGGHGQEEGLVVMSSLYLHGLCISSYHMHLLPSSWPC